MRTCRTVQEHWISACDWHVERANVCLSILEGNMSAVDSPLHRGACCVGSGLRDSMVTIAELELNHIANCSDH